MAARRRPRLLHRRRHRRRDAHVALAVDAPLSATRCTDGIAPASFTVSDAPGSGTLYLDGVDPVGVALYHGELSLDAAPPGTGETRVVTLYAAAAE